MFHCDIYSLLHADRLSRNLKLAVLMPARKKHARKPQMVFYTPLEFLQLPVMMLKSNFSIACNFLFTEKQRKGTRLARGLLSLIQNIQQVNEKIPFDYKRALESSLNPSQISNFTHFVQVLVQQTWMKIWDHIYFTLSLNFV